MASGVRTREGTSWAYSISSLASTKASLIASSCRNTPESLKGNTSELCGRHAETNIADMRDRHLYLALAILKSGECPGLK